MFQTKCNLCHKPVSFFYLHPMLKHEKKSCINCEAKYCRSFMVHVYRKKRNANDNNPVLLLVLRLQL